MLKKIFCFLVILIMLIAMLAACAPKQRGTFYTLQEAYDQGLLTQDDLKSIAYYQNEGSDDESFTPIPKNPEVLSAKTEKAIRETKAYYFRNQSPYPIKEAKSKDIRILKYYGTYNNLVAVMFDDAYGGHFDAEVKITIAGVLFHYLNSITIIIWKGN